MSDRVTDLQISDWQDLAFLTRHVSSVADELIEALISERDRADKATEDAGKWMEAAQSLADDLDKANHTDKALRELLKEQRRRMEVAKELLRRSDNNLSRMGEECAHLQTTRARQGKRILGLIEQSNRRLERLGKVRAELRWHRTVGNCEGAA